MAFLLFFKQFSISVSEFLYKSVYFNKEMVVFLCCSEQWRWFECRNKPKELVERIISQDWPWIWYQFPNLIISDRIIKPFQFIIIIWLYTLNVFNWLPVSLLEFFIIRVILIWIIMLPEKISSYVSLIYSITAFHVLISKSLSSLFYLHTPFDIMYPLKQTTQSVELPQA